MMKFSTLALALIAATPFVAAEYTCQNEAFFQMDDIKPSKEGLEHLQSVMVDSFEEAYKNNADIDMVSDKFEKVSHCCPSFPTVPPFFGLRLDIIFVSN